MAKIHQKKTEESGSSVEGVTRHSKAEITQKHFKKTIPIQGRTLKSHSEHIKLMEMKARISIFLVGPTIDDFFPNFKEVFSFVSCFNPWVAEIIKSLKE